MSKLANGYRVIGDCTTSPYNLHAWYFPTLETANAFAKQLCQDTGKTVEVTKFLGLWRKAAPPVEFITADDDATLDPKETDQL